MAVSAFKSRTKRNCDISIPDIDAASFSMSTSKRSHRRTKSFTDSSCMYLSDSSPSSAYKTRPFSRHPSSDTESDGDAFGDHQKGRREMAQLQCEPRYMSPLQRQIDDTLAYQSASSLSINRVRRSSSFKDLSEISKLGDTSDVEGRNGNLSKRKQDIAQSRCELRYMSHSQRQINEARGYESSYSSSKSECRRSSRDKNPSQTLKQSASRYGGKIDHKQGSEGHSEIQEVEERTIRAVHAQTKTLERDPPAGDSNGVGLYEMMRAEIQRAVEEIKDFQQSLVGRIQNAHRSEESSENVVRPLLDKLHEDASRPPNNHAAARFLQSSQRDRGSHPKLEEDSISIDCVKLAGDSHLEPCSQVLTRPRRPRRGADKQMVTKSLDEDARKYFEECVTILKLENLEAEESFSDGPSFADFQEDIGLLSKEHAVEKLHQESTREENNASHLSNEKEGTAVKIRAVNADGVVMPWLDWDSDHDADSMRCKHENSQSQISKELSCKSEIFDGYALSSKFVSGCRRGEWRSQSRTTAPIHRPNAQFHDTRQKFNVHSKCFTFETDHDLSQCQISDSQPKVGTAVGACSGEVDFKSAKMECSSFVKETLSNCSQHMNGSLDSPVDNPNMLISDTILCHRNAFRSRIAQGRLLLCGQKL